MPSLPLDASVAYHHHTTGPWSVEDCALNCSDAVDEALEEWPVSRRTPNNAAVSSGFLLDSDLRSTLWTQSFDVAAAATTAAGSERNGKNAATADPTTAAIPRRDDLLAALDDVFAPTKDMGKHAAKWDQTFAGCRVLGKKPQHKNSDDDNNGLVHWKFDASPLAGRDMLYVIHTLRQTQDDFPDHPDAIHNSSNNNSSNNNINKNNGDGADRNHRRRILRRITYAYTSVGEDWATKHFGSGAALDDNGTRKKRVRALNCFPSCDRVTVYEESPPPSSGGGARTIVVVDHLMTTDLGGWVRPWCFNNLFKKALIDANAHESEALRSYVLQLCAQRREERRANQQRTKQPAKQPAKQRNRPSTHG